MIELRYIGLIILGVICCACKENKTQEPVRKLPYFNSSDYTPEWEKGTHKIPKFLFTNQDSLTINNKTFEGKIYIADFFFTSCSGICSKLVKNMSSLQEMYKNDTSIMLLSHTVMPWRDSVPVLKAYANMNKVDNDKWHLVTGNKDDLYNIARNGYFADEDFIKTQDESNFIHTENFILVDKQGFIRGVYNGTLEVDIDRLKRHIEILKTET